LRSICPPFVAGSIVSLPVVNVDIRKEMKNCFMVMLMTRSLLGMSNYKVTSTPEFTE
jgi:hypothetical protein